MSVEVYCLFVTCFAGIVMLNHSKIVKVLLLLLAPAIINSCII